MSLIAGKDELRPFVVVQVQDTSGKLGESDYDKAIAQAVLRFSRRRPRRVVVEIAATGAKRYPMPAPWVTDSTSLLVVELVDAAGDETQLEARDYQVRLGPAGDELRLTNAPAAGTTIRLTIGVGHLIDDATSTIPSADLDTLAQLSGGFACLALAALYSGRNDAAIRADFVQHGSKGSEFAKRAKELFAAAGEEISIESAPAASAGGAGAGSARAAAAEVSFAAEMVFLSH